MTGEELERIRNEYHWTAVELARWLGVSRKSLHEWESAAEVPLIVERAIGYLALTEVRPAPVARLDTRSVEEKYRWADEKYQDREELTFQESAEYLNINRRTLLVWKNKGRLPNGREGNMHDGKQWRKVHLYPKAALDPLRRNKV